MAQNNGELYLGEWKDLPDDFRQRWHNPQSERRAATMGVTLWINNSNDKSGSKYCFRRSSMSVMLLKKNRTVEHCLDCLKNAKVPSQEEILANELKNDNRIMQECETQRKRICDALSKGMNAITKTGVITLQQPSGKVHLECYKKVAAVAQARGKDGVFSEVRIKAEDVSAESAIKTLRNATDKVLQTASLNTTVYCKEQIARLSQLFQPIEKKKGNMSLTFYPLEKKNREMEARLFVWPVLGELQVLGFPDFVLKADKSGELRTRKPDGKFFTEKETAKAIRNAMKVFADNLFALLSDGINNMGNEAKALHFQIEIFLGSCYNVHGSIKAINKKGEVELDVCGNLGRCGDKKNVLKMAKTFSNAIIELVQEALREKAMCNNPKFLGIKDYGPRMPVVLAACAVSAISKGRNATLKKPWIVQGHILSEFENIKGDYPFMITKVKQCVSELVDAQISNGEGKVLSLFEHRWVNGSGYSYYKYSPTNKEALKELSRSNNKWSIKDLPYIEAKRRLEIFQKIVENADAKLVAKALDSLNLLPVAEKKKYVASEDFKKLFSNLNKADRMYAILIVESIPGCKTLAKQLEAGQGKEGGK